MTLGDPNKSICLFVFLTIVASVMCLDFGGWAIYNVVKINSWASTKGVIIDSKLVESSMEKTRYWSEIYYKYTIGDMAYITTQFTVVGADSYSPLVLSKDYWSHPVGKQVIVYYNPIAPSESVILKYTVETWIPLTFGIGLLLFSVIKISQLSGPAVGCAAVDPKPLKNT